MSIVSGLGIWIEVALVLLIVRSLFSNLAVGIILRYLCSAGHLNGLQLTNGKHLVFILKVFNEVPTIADTCEYLLGLCRGRSNIKVIIVGTFRERDMQGRNPTLDIARRETKGCDFISIIECPYEGSHAVQNNYGLSFIKSDPSLTWVMTLDVDSRTGSVGLDQAIEQINNDRIVIQQSTAFLSNYERLSHLQKGHALYQSRWTIAHEMKRIMMHNCCGLSVAHVVGHGLCINLRTLNELGNFPEDTPFEDIHLGFYISTKGIPIVPLRSLELGDTPVRVMDGLRQEFSWSVGAMNYPRYVFRYLRQFPVTQPLEYFRIFGLATHGFIGYLGWLISSWVLLGTTYLAVQGMQLASLFLFLYVFEYLQCIRYFYQRGWLKLSDAVVSPFYFAFGFYRRSFPANACLAVWLAKKKVSKYKTRHNKGSCRN